MRYDHDEDEVMVERVTRRDKFDRFKPDHEVAQRRSQRRQRVRGGRWYRRQHEEAELRKLAHAAANLLRPRVA